VGGSFISRSFSSWGELLGFAVLAYALVGSTLAQVPSTCAVDVPALSGNDDQVARAVLNSALDDGDAACAAESIRQRHVALFDRDADDAVAARFVVRDVALHATRNESLSADNRARLVLAALTPAEAPNGTSIDVRADIKLLRLAAAEFVEGKAFGAWLDVLSRAVAVYQRTDADVSWISYWGDDPFLLAWQSGESTRLLALARQIGNESRWGELAGRLALAFFQSGTACHNQREPPSADVVRACRRQLDALPRIEAMGCARCLAGGLDVLIIAGIVLQRSGAGAEASLVIERAIGRIEALPVDQRIIRLSNLISDLRRYRFKPERLVALGDEVETLRITRYQPLFPPVR
jgi:hypothetical protein